MPEPRFKAGDIVRTKDNQYPYGCRLVIEVTDTAYKSAPLGGGFVMTCAHDGLRDYVLVAPREMLSPLPFTDGLFTIDGWGSLHVGVTRGHRWNGWECPAFTRPVAERICQDHLLEYQFLSDEILVLEDDDWVSYPAVNVDGVTHYALGSGAWTWESVYIEEGKE